MELPRYKCHKEVRALRIKEINCEPSNPDAGADIIPIDSAYSPIEVSVEYLMKHSPQPNGYYVLYEDGYESYSPAEAFESGYTLIKE
jgi:hypothetical protein